MREKVLVYGANFQLAARIVELIKRNYEVVAHNFAPDTDAEHVRLDASFNGELLPKLVRYHGAVSVIVTTEALLYIDSSTVLDGLVHELKHLKRLCAVRLIVVDINQPVVARTIADRLQIRLLSSSSSYYKNLVAWRQALDGLIDLNLQIESFYSCISDTWGPNFMHTLMSSVGTKKIEILAEANSWWVISADAVAVALESGMGRLGNLTLEGFHWEGGLPSFCSTVRTTFAPWVAVGGPTEGFSQISPTQADLPVHVDLDAFAHQVRCSVNYLYRKDPVEMFGDESVAKFRFELGQVLGQSIPCNIASTIDAVVPVPETGKMYAQGLAQSLGSSYLEAIFKTDRKRSFDIESFDIRKEFLYDRLGVLPDLLVGKNIVIVDEAIFTGATLKVVSRLLQSAGAAKVYLAIPSPETKEACRFNMQPKRALLSDYVRKEDLGSYFNVDAVFFQDEQVFIEAFGRKGLHCLNCFTARGV